MELSSFFKEIILIHDCVIIPELGGFIANYRPAIANIQNNSFKAPSREIAFNSKLTKNDGVLINWLVEEQGMNYNDASSLVSAFVSESFDLLNRGEKINFPQIGSLQFDQNHNLIFEPKTEQNLLLDAFGLETFFFQDLASEQIAAGTHLTVEQKETVKRLFHTKHLRKIAVASSLLLALWAIPVDNNQAEMEHSSVLPALTELEPKQVNNETITSIHSVEVAPATLKAKKAAIKNILSQSKPQAMKSYHIIVGSFKNQINAHSYEVELAREGHSPKLFPLKNGYFRVSIDSYETQQEAILALKMLKQTNKSLSAWILRK
ncbi:hypothetical protein EMN47_05195 [Prolixibacteraceae bacterium JC049]|nr:hypothetical protein [Prolixibacteraceae bacterium JC049]